jgi:hypothetical protein
MEKHMKRTANQIIQHLQKRVARLERQAGYPPANETAVNRQGKITHLLTIILDSCPTLSDFDRGFISDMKRILNRRKGIEPATALTEKQSRTLRKIIFRRYRDYKHAVPSLPAGVKFEDEVRRLLKSQPNPNEKRNALIEKAKAKAEDRYDQYKYVGMDGDDVIFIVRKYYSRYDFMWEHDERVDYVKKISISPDGRSNDIETILVDSWTDHSDTWSFKDKRTDKRPYTLADCRTQCVTAGHWYW